MSLRPATAEGVVVTGVLPWPPTGAPTEAAVFLFTQPGTTILPRVISCRRWLKGTTTSVKAVLVESAPRPAPSQQAPGHERLKGVAEGVG